MHKKSKIIPDKRVYRQRFTKDDREFLLLKTNGVCGHCGKPLTGSTATVDHVVPVNNHGTNDERNLVCLCYECNQSKGSRIVAPSGYYKYLNKEAMRDTLDYFNEYNFIAIYDHGDAFNKFTIIDEFKLFANEMSLDSFGFSKYISVMLGVPMNDFAFHGFMKDLTGFSIKKANYSHLDEIYRQYKAFLNKDKVPMSYDKVKKYTHKQLKDAFMKGAVYFFDSDTDGIVGWFTLRVVLVDNERWELRLDNLIYKDVLRSGNSSKCLRRKFLNLLTYSFLEQVCKELGLEYLNLRVSTPSATVRGVAEDIALMNFYMNKAETDYDVCEDTEIFRDNDTHYFFVDVTNPYTSRLKYSNVLPGTSKSSTDLYSSEYFPQEYVDFVEEQSAKSPQTVLFEKFGKSLINVYGYTDEIMA